MMIKDDILKLQRAFNHHKGNANFRKIPFLLSFDEWLQIWLESNHLSERGRGIGTYVMGRFNDIGPYAINNVSIISSQENTSQPRKGKKKLYASLYSGYRTTNILPDTPKLRKPKKISKYLTEIKSWRRLPPLGLH